MRKICVVVLLIFGALIFFPKSGSAQTIDSKWSAGFDVMGNILQGDFTAHPLFFSGDLFARRDIFSNASLYGGITFGGLKTALDQNEFLAHPTFPAKIATNYTGLEVYAGLHLQTIGFQPEIFLGAEFLHFDPETATSDPLPPAIGINKNVLAFLIGIGFEFPIGNNGLALNAKGMLHLVSSKYLDNYAGASNDGFLTAGVGLSYTFGNAAPANASDLTKETTPLKDTAKKSWDGKVDSDGDGISDDDEINKYHTDPHKADTDGDGLNDFQEIYVYRTDPNKQDTDGDGLFDGEEVLKYGTDPLSWDSDGDGLADGYEVNILHTNPKNHDTDGDGIWDKLDKCPLVKGVPPEGCPAK